MSQTLCIAGEPVAISDVVRVSAGAMEVVLSDASSFVARIEAGARIVHERLLRGIPTYGVNTGFGASIENVVRIEDATALAHNLVRYHGAGAGPLLSAPEARAVMFARLVSLTRGYSGVRYLLLQRLTELLQRDVIAAIPARGSVGASGDLTPLSYIAALLMGERRAFCGGRLMPSADALSAHGIAPMSLMPKESLALMNGTSAMVGVACLGIARVRRLAQLSALATALVLEASGSQVSHLDERLHAQKGHPGQSEAARLMRAELALAERPGSEASRLQERYSLRCAPHVLGALFDALEFAERVLTRELNAVSDNPLVDPDTGDVLHGGNFYGGHVAMICDLLKTQVASVAELLERQLVSLNDPGRNGGLPQNLVGVSGASRSAHHGFKAMEITASALVAEALKSTVPASAFSRSTEAHNQDKVSMGMHAALDLRDMVALAEQVLAIHVLAGCQALDLATLRPPPKAIAALHATVRTKVPMLHEDRAMDSDIEAVCALIESGELGSGAAMPGASA